jgi:hypothetical protein
MMTEKIVIDKEDFEFLLDLAQDTLYGTYKGDPRYPYGKEWNQLIEKYNVEGYAKVPETFEEMKKAEHWKHKFGGNKHD